jgi:hypothetical protein
MSEKELLELGFTKEFGEDVIEDDPDFYYYVKEITNGLTFITNGNDEMEGQDWYVEFFDTEVPIRYYEYKFEFIPDLETGYIDADDNSYNVDELASVFLDIGQDIPRGKYNQKYKGKGGTYVVVA